MPVNVGKSIQHSKDSHTLGIVIRAVPQICMILNDSMAKKLLDAKLRNLNVWKGAFMQISKC